MNILDLSEAGRSSGVREKASDMFSGDLVMDGPEMGEYLADKYKLKTV